MRKFPLFVAMVTLPLLTACTTQSTRLAINNYELTENRRQEAFDNAYRIANEQMLLNLSQFLAAHPERANESIVATWKARQVLEEARRQYALGRDLARMTVGTYIYDQQGVLNVMFESSIGTAKRATDAAVRADDEAGVNSVKDLVTPIIKGSVPVPTPTTQPSKDSLVNQLQRLLENGRKNSQ